MPSSTGFVPCAFAPCNRKHYAQRYCAAHYKQFKRVGAQGLHVITDARGRSAPRFAKGARKRDRWIKKNGYVATWDLRPDAVGDSWVHEHRYVMELTLGRRLRKGESVHHRNGIKHDNHLGNLELWVVAQPAGQRVEDLLAWARELIDEYEPIMERLHVAA